MLIRVLFVAFLSLPVLLTAADKSLLKPGTDAPDFTLTTEEGDTIRLSSFRGKSSVVLIFYPGDNTPGCTAQLCEIRDNFNGFAEKGALVFGVNPGSAKSHQSFVDKFTFQFPLLIDKGLKVGKVYGTKRLFMQKRTVYVIDKNGKIIYAKRGKPPVEEIISVLE
jgi:peroxiredoxin Q/BCP